MSLFTAVWLDFGSVGSVGVFLVYGCIIIGTVILAFSRKWFGLHRKLNKKMKKYAESKIKLLDPKDDFSGHIDLEKEHD